MYPPSGEAFLFPFPSIGAFIERHADRLVHLHLHDFDGKRDHKPIGEGTIDFADIARALHNIDYDGAICLEFTAEIPRSAIIESREKLRALLEQPQSRSER